MIYKTGKFFTKHKALGAAVGISVPGLVQAGVSHPFEHAQTGRSGTPKYLEIKDSTGKVIKRQKNPERYGKIKFPGVKPIEYDRGDPTEHFLARVPKSLVNSVAILGTVKAMGRLGIPKL